MLKHIILILDYCMNSQDFIEVCEQGVNGTPLLRY